MKQLVLALALSAALTTPATADMEAVNRALARGDDAAALKAATPLAEAGDAQAAHIVAGLHLHGRGTRQSPRTAVGWYRRAAAHGHPEAQLMLARLTMVGQGTALDFVEAYKWFVLSARKGNRAARRMVPELKAQLSRSQLALAEKRIAAWKPGN